MTDSLSAKFSPVDNSTRTIPTNDYRVLKIAFIVAGVVVFGGTIGATLYLHKAQLLNNVNLGIVAASGTIVSLVFIILGLKVAKEKQIDEKDPSIKKERRFVENYARIKELFKDVTTFNELFRLLEPQEVFKGQVDKIFNENDELRTRVFASIRENFAKTNDIRHFIDLANGSNFLIGWSPIKCIEKDVLVTRLREFLSKLHTFEELGNYFWGAIWHVLDSKVTKGAPAFDGDHEALRQRWINAYGNK